MTDNNPTKSNQSGYSTNSSSSSSNSNSTNASKETNDKLTFINNKISSVWDIQHVKINTIYFAKCAIKGWFVNHWALILERQDGKYLTLQFVKSGLEVERTSLLDRAKDSVARCSNASKEQVQIKKLAKSKNMTVGDVMIRALRLN